MNTADYLLAVGEAEAPVVITDRYQYSYRDLREASARLAAELVKAGVRPGERVGILGRNSLFWIAAYLAILKVGGVAVPFSPALTLSDAVAMQALAQCKAFCTDEREARRLAQLFDPQTALIPESVLRHPGMFTWPATEVVDEHDDAALMFTSGTTARPKAVRITHRNLQANTESILAYLDLSASDRMMVVLPFYYCFGTSLLHTHLRVGGALVLSNSFAYPEVTLDLLEATHATGFAGVPTTYQTLLRNSTFPKRRFPALKKVQQAGGKLQPILIRELVAALPDTDVFVMYGQTEATARLSYLPPACLPTKLGSVGKGIPGVTLCVVNDQGVAVSPDEMGEIIARGDNISPGYLNDPEASARKFVHGALHTGDLATVDEDGFIYIVDRANDFIKSQGYRISSQQIEDCILELPDVISVAVVGEPDLVLGEAIKAFVVPRQGASLTSADVTRHCGQRLARHMVPKVVTLVDALPQTSHGKLAKSKLQVPGR